MSTRGLDLHEIQVGTKLFVKFRGRHHLLKYKGFTRYFFGQNGTQLISAYVVVYRIYSSRLQINRKRLGEVEASEVVEQDLKILV